MLKDNFYRVIASTHTDGLIEVDLQFNPTHAIFEGHFPGQPVVPGVCLLQMVKETLASVLSPSVVLATADYLKFIALVIPQQEQQLHLQVKYSIADEQLIKATAVLKADTVACFKFQGVFRSS